MAKERIKIKPKSRRYKPKTRKTGFTRKKRPSSKKAVRSAKFRQDYLYKFNKYGEIVDRDLIKSKKIPNKQKK